MTEYYKLLFDLSLFYTISGYYLMLTTEQAPSVFLFLALVAASGLDSLFRARRLYHPGKYGLRLLPLFLPLLALFSRPSLGQILQSLPAWLYLGWTTLSGRIDLDYSEARSHFSFGLRLLLLMIFGPLFHGRLGVTIIRTIPYLVIMLASGVCLLRMLREQRPDGLRQGLYLAAFVLICVLLTVGKAPQLLVKGFGYVYRGVIAPLIFALAIVFGVLMYGFYILLAWIVKRAQGQEEELQIDLESAADMLGLQEEYTTYTTNLRWLVVLLAVLGVLLLLFILFLIFRRLLGERQRSDENGPWRESSITQTSDLPVKRSSGILRPRDPRLAVRYYYARFVAECRKRGISVPRGMTVTELAVHCAAAFPDADPKTLAALYLPSRYSTRTDISQEDAALAAESWRLLKRSKTAAKKRVSSK